MQTRVFKGKETDTIVLLNQVTESGNFVVRGCGIQSEFVSLLSLNNLKRILTASPKESLKDLDFT